MFRKVLLKLFLGGLCSAHSLFIPMNARRDVLGEPSDVLVFGSLSGPDVPGLSLTLSGADRSAPDVPGNAVCFWYNLG